jgi:hypothetical protein
MTFHADQEHGGLRAALFGLFLLAWAVGFLLLDALLTDGGLNLIALLGGLGIGYGVSHLAERALKGRWQSGRTVTLTEGALVQTERGRETTRIAWADAAVYTWRFVIRRRARVPKGWWMMAVGVYDVRAGTAIIAYTLVSPADGAAQPHADRFVLLESAGKTERQAPAGENLRGGDLHHADPTARLRDAERLRWIVGLELVPADFARFTTGVLAQAAQPDAV